jgi:hypothetical protein
MPFRRRADGCPTVVLVDLGGLARSVGAGYLNGVAVVATA